MFNHNTLRFKSSAYLLVYIILFNILIIISLLIIDLVIWAKLLIGIVISYASYKALKKYYWFTEKNSISALSWSPDAWKLEFFDGRIEHARLLPSSRSHRCGSILNFALPAVTDEPTHTLIIFPDAANRQTLRRLRVFLRFNDFET